MRKILSKYIKVLFFMVLIVAMQSCKKNYLGVSDQLAPELTMEKVFSNPTLTRQYYATILSGMPNFSWISINQNGEGAPTGTDNPWTALSDEVKIAWGSPKNVAANGYNAGNAEFGRWVPLYKLIRQANVFLENAKTIPQTGSSDFINEQEMTKMKNISRFFRAYYHYLLFEQYGPVPVMDKAIDPSNPNLDFARNSVDEVVKFIADELTAVTPGLDDVSPSPSVAAVPTKGVALAVKAKLLVYAASPLFNGGFSEALGLKNKDGKSLFSAADQSKWQKAKLALEDFLTFANGKFDLFKLNTGPGGTYNPDESLYRLFIDVDNNKEIIWANPTASWGSVDGDGTDRRVTPRTERVGLASIGVTQELVDAFPMIDGLPISESPLYSENGFSVEGEDPTGRTETGTFKMWIKRDPRFYQTVFYQNRRWPISNNQIQFQKGSGNDNSAADNPNTGYLLHKRFARNVRNEGTNPKSQYRPSIIFRLAEFYLLYAEVCNEVNPADPNVFVYLDKIRERAGIPKLSAIKPGLSGNKEGLRKAIQAESRVELATEGQRYFDVRRWMIADQIGNKQGGPSTGMNMNSNQLTIGGFYTRTTYETRIFNKSMYLYPLPLTEIQKSKLLVQNPLW
ncbi:RagB/SusD family nutrient uptake outer membrane protein [Pedobacter nyackensis]|uniref:RagB/SusD family nutrient uptake outer membrane protein n=1 Tax=Pedobacter nyackensis TaxID=475255 RepID=UPI0029314876|nr:RagB/SusD family nutrient uptake outer membrane protein [Pedobacter nyackensis]